MTDNEKAITWGIAHPEERNELRRRQRQQQKKQQGIEQEQIK